MTSLRLPLALALTAFAIGACGGPGTPKSPFASKPNAQIEDAGDPEADVAFEMSRDATRGAAAMATVTVRPKAPWHINVEFPVKLQLSAPTGVTLPSPNLAKSDAQRYDDDALVFEVPYRVDACGAHEITGNVDFALCRDEACAPVTEAVSASVTVC